MGAPIVHWEINAKDAKRTQEFFGNLFGWNINANNPMNYGLVNTGSKKGIQGGIGAKQGPNMPNVTFYVEVDNPQTYLEKALSMGASVVLPVTEMPNMATYALFSDPEGNVVGLVKTAQPPKVARPKRGSRPKKAPRGRKKRGRR